MSLKKLCVIFFMSLAVAVNAEVKMSNLFSDNMVLQRDIPVPVWGTADAGEKVAVKIGGTEAAAVADANGKWLVKLTPMKVNSTPQEMIVRGKNTLTMKNILVGDVWMCSGQSNMEWPLSASSPKEDLESVNYPNLRRIKLDRRTSATPVNEVTRKWEICTPRNAGGFTAVGFYFARKIQKETGVPVGLIDNNWGGTRIEAWTAPCGFASEPALSSVSDRIKKSDQAYREQLAKSLEPLEKWIAEVRKSAADPHAGIPADPPIPTNPNSNQDFPSTIYNGQICPIIPFAIKGAIWYQGEANGRDSVEEYQAKMRALIGGWRKEWKQGDFPFYFVQLPSYQPTDSPMGDEGWLWSRIRMAQLKSLEIPNTGMAVAIDLADADNPGSIHPKNKLDVGERLALWALARDYGKKDLVYSGPLYKSMKIETGKIRIEFESTGSGLIVGKKAGLNPVVEEKGEKLKRFAIAGEDKKWVWANAVIDGNTVVVSSPDVPQPVAVRYAYSMNPTGCNLYNKEGLPASPFKTDGW